MFYFYVISRVFGLTIIFSIKILNKGFFNDTIASEILQLIPALSVLSPPGLSRLHLPVHSSCRSGLPLLLPGLLSGLLSGLLLFLVTFTLVFL